MYIVILYVTVSVKTLHVSMQNLAHFLRFKLKSHNSVTNDIAKTLLTNGHRSSSVKQLMIAKSTDVLYLFL